jgi:hypothetical protein
MANKPRTEIILRHAGIAWSRAAVLHEYQPQMRPMNATANAENTVAFNIAAYITSQAEHVKSVLAVSPLCQRLRKSSERTKVVDPPGISMNKNRTKRKSRSAP